MRSITIARTEINQAQNAGNFHGLEKAEVDIPGLKHMWLSSRDGERVRPTHRVADGQVRKIGELFTVGTCTMAHPQDVSRCSQAKEIVNCRCRTTPVVPIAA